MASRKKKLTSEKENKNYNESNHERRKKGIALAYYSYYKAKAELEKAEKEVKRAEKFHREEICMERNGNTFIFKFELDECGCYPGRIVYARKDTKTGRWVLRENGKQLLKRCPYNLDEIRLKLAIGEL
jgi:hypothetical protein